MSIRTSKIVEKAVIWASATILLYLFIDANSPVYIISFLPYLNIDLSFLLVPFTVLFIFLFASSISSTLIKEGAWKDAAQKGLRGLAISTFILVSFLWAPIPVFATDILVPLELTIIVFTGVIIASGFLKHQERYDPLFAALYTAILAYAVYDIARVLSQVYEPIANAVLPFTAGLLAVSAGALFGLFRDTDKLLISKISEWIYGGPVRNFTVSFFLTIYVNFVRPSVKDFPPTVIGEWITIVIVVAVLLNAARGSSRKFHHDFEFPEWKKHVREPQRQTGRDFKHLVSAQERFVNQGIKEPLLVYLALTLHDMGENEERILTTLAPLVYYRDRKPSFWNLPWTRRKVEKENTETRRKLLESLLQEIEKSE